MERVGRVVEGVSEGFRVGSSRSAAPFTCRPVYYGTRGLVTAGHYLAADRGAEAFDRGGNAADAAATAGWCLTVLLPQSNGIGGEVPVLIWDPKERQTFAVSGQGGAPRLASVKWFREQGISLIPGDGLLPATVPAAFGTWLRVLQRFGRLGLAETLGPAVELAESGFAVYPGLHHAIRAQETRFQEWWPSSGTVYLRNGHAPAIGAVLRNPAWARTFKAALDIEVRERRRGREAVFDTVFDWFYRGPVAEAIDRFCREMEVQGVTGTYHGLLRKEDLQGFRVRFEGPVSLQYRGVEVMKCGPWSQGPVFLQTLALLAGFDLPALGHNSVRYIHTVTEALKLAFADREAYYGDPEFVPVPLDRLLSEDYAALRRRNIQPDRAAGQVLAGLSDWKPQPSGMADDPRVYRGDTTHVDAADSEGMFVAATPSGGWIPSSPVIPDLGFPLGTRGQMFVLEPEHPNVLQPGKRPRTTLTPSLVLRDGRPWLAFGTPGGDQQDQWTLEFFLNVVDFGMDVQSAVEAPTFHTLHLRDSFYPRNVQPLRLAVEGRIDSGVRQELESMGHDVVVNGDWTHGQVTGIAQLEGGVLAGAASPRGQTAYVAGR
ncbi:MAG: gamma-glutamyltransferase family protein [Chloroflexi bacterium]|nr:gamma-glutamyltransferase family protein [Chloroflexota bacterium]